MYNITNRAKWPMGLNCWIKRRISGPWNASSLKRKNPLSVSIPTERGRYIFDRECVFFPCVCTGDPISAERESLIMYNWNINLPWQRRGCFPVEYFCLFLRHSYSRKSSTFDLDCYWCCYVREWAPNSVRPGRPVSVWCDVIRASHLQQQAASAFSREQAFGGGGGSWI